MKRLWTPGWIVRHVAMVVLVVAFCALGWWQISRAAAGNTLSWAYAVEWPVFAGFVVFVWWREVRLTLRGGRAESDPEHPGSGNGPAGPASGDDPQGGTPAGGQRAGAGSGSASDPGVRRPVRVTRRVEVTADTEDAELAAYNRYLSWLNANPGARPGDYPG